MESPSKATCLQLRRFLKEDYGKEVFGFLRRQTPRIGGLDKDGVTFTAGKSEGWRLCLDMMEALADVDAKKEVEIENK